MLIFRRRRRAARRAAAGRAAAGSALRGPPGRSTSDLFGVGEQRGEVQRREVRPRHRAAGRPDRVDDPVALVQRRRRPGCRTQPGDVDHDRRRRRRTGSGRRAGRRPSRRAAARPSSMRTAFGSDRMYHRPRRGDDAPAPTHDEPDQLAAGPARSGVLSIPSVGHSSPAHAGARERRRRCRGRRSRTLAQRRRDAVSDAASQTGVTPSRVRRERSAGGDDVDQPRRRARSRAPDSRRPGGPHPRRPAPARGTSPRSRRPETVMPVADLPVDLDDQRRPRPGRARSSSHDGHAAQRTPCRCSPSASCHSSSAMCGANGATIFTSVAAAARTGAPPPRVQRVQHLVRQRHQPRDRDVEPVVVERARDVLASSGAPAAAGARRLARRRAPRPPPRTRPRNTRPSHECAPAAGHASAQSTSSSNGPANSIVSPDRVGPPPLHQRQRLDDVPLGSSTSPRPR